MRQAVSMVLTFLMLAHLAQADTPSVTTQITAMSVGTNIELRLKNREKLRGARGAVSDIGFTLVNQSTGDRQIAFDDVASVKLFTHKSHALVYVLVGLGIAAVAVGITIAVVLTHAKY